jgi:hypothetical protein
MLKIINLFGYIEILANFVACQCKTLTHRLLLKFFKFFSEKRKPMFKRPAFHTASTVNTFCLSS